MVVADMDLTQAGLQNCFHLQGPSRNCFLVFLLVLFVSTPCDVYPVLLLLLCLLQVVAAFVYYGLVMLVPQLEFVAGESKECLNGSLQVPVSSAFSLRGGSLRCCVHCLTSFGCGQKLKTTSLDATHTISKGQPGGCCHHQACCVVCYHMALRHVCAPEMASPGTS
jgi:hypothetical protein